MKPVWGHFNKIGPARVFKKRAELHRAEPPVEGGPWRGARGARNSSITHIGILFKILECGFAAVGAVASGFGNRARSRPKGGTLGGKSDFWDFF